jgi:hypothetical protein
VDAGITKLRRFNTLQEAETELEGARAPGSGVYPPAARGMVGNVLASWSLALAHFS